MVTSGTVMRSPIEASLASSLYTLGFQLAFLLDEPDSSFDANGEPTWVRGTTCLLKTFRAVARDN